MHSEHPPMPPCDHDDCGPGECKRDSYDIWLFGCIGAPGHCMHNRTPPHPAWDSTPWGNQVDGGLAPQQDCVTGEYVEHHKDGWTAVSFWDRSGDHRPGSNTNFFVAHTVTGEELIAMARKQWPEVFARRGFPKLIPLKAHGQE